MSEVSQPRALISEWELNRLVKLTAPERAKLYDVANLSLAERSMVEVEVRARVAAEFGRGSR
jgi:hypothetical protein